MNLGVRYVFPVAFLCKYQWKLFFTKMSQSHTVLPHALLHVFHCEHLPVALYLPLTLNVVPPGRSGGFLSCTLIIFLAQGTCLLSAFLCTPRASSHGRSPAQNLNLFDWTPNCPLGGLTTSSPTRSTGLSLSLRLAKKVPRWCLQSSHGWKVLYESCFHVKVFDD